MRPVHARARRAAAVLLALTGSLALSTGVASADPTITVDPTGALATKSTVNVTAKGFAPGTTVVVAQCRPDDNGTIAKATQCADPTTGSSAVVVADPEGAITASITITVGDIRSGVSCTGQDCVVAAVSTVSAAIQASAQVTLTGDSTTLPAATSPSATASATATPSGMASPSETAAASASASATPEPTTAEPSSSPAVAPVETPPADSGARPATLPRTGPDDAGRSLLLGLIALQVGLMVAVRQRRSGPAVAGMGGRHRR